MTVAGEGSGRLVTRRGRERWRSSSDRPFRWLTMLVGDWTSVCGVECKTLGNQVCELPGSASRIWIVGVRYSVLLRERDYTWVGLGAQSALLRVAPAMALTWIPFCSFRVPSFLCVDVPQRPRSSAFLVPCIGIIVLRLRGSHLVGPTPLRVP